MFCRLQLWFALVVLPACLSCAQRGKVTAVNLNLRMGPSVKSASAGMLRKGDSVRILGREGEWYRVFPMNGLVGYVPSNALTGKKLNKATELRQKAEAASMGICSLQTGTMVKVLESRKGWSKINVGDNGSVRLYVHGNYVDADQKETGPKRIFKRIPFDGVRPSYGIMIYDVQRRSEIWSQNADMKKPIASLTKMMTLLIALEDIAGNPRISLDTMVPISARAAGEAPTKACLVAGRTIRMEELLSVMILISCNDCAACAGEYFGGGTMAGFARRMNLKANLLGMNSSKFFNANGLPGNKVSEDNVSTPRDMLKLTQALLSYPLAREWVKRSTASISTGVVKPTTFKGHTPLLGQYGVDGVKTGYTRRAGSCVATHAKNSSGEYIIIILGCEGSGTRNMLLENILKWLNKR